VPMTPIDLIDYTHSKKIPSALLSQNSVEAIDIKSSKIIAAYFIDFMTITTISVMASAFLILSFNSWMVTSSLENAFEAIEFSSIIINFLPLMFMSYFFFSFFFNHGQTWGMNKMNHRIEMKEMSFRSSLVWAMFSTTLMMTGGLSFLFTYNWMKDKNFGAFKKHDHLYFELMQERNVVTVNPVTISKTQDQAEPVEKTYLKAA
jgi:hypothetical protein